MQRLCEVSVFTLVLPFIDPLKIRSVSVFFPPKLPLISGHIQYVESYVQISFPWWCFILTFFIYRRSRVYTAMPECFISSQLSWYVFLIVNAHPLYPFFFKPEIDSLALSPPLLTHTTMASDVLSLLHYRVAYIRCVWLRSLGHFFCVVPRICITSVIGSNMNHLQCTCICNCQCSLTY